MKTPCRVLKLMPVADGAAGVPVPSVQESFCIQEMLNCPAVTALKRPLLAGEELNCSVTPETVQSPAPNWVSKEARAPAVSNWMTLCNSPCGLPGAARDSAPAPP